MAFDPYELDRDYGAPSGVITEAQYTTRAFLWMMLGLMVTFGVALVGWMTNATLYLFSAFPTVHLVILVVMLILSYSLSARIEKMSVASAQMMFLVFSALMGVTASTWLYLYQLTSIVFIFLATALYFGALAAYGHFTSRSLAGYKSILLSGLIFLILFGVLSLFIPGMTAFDSMISLFGVAIFLGYTAYDTHAYPEVLLLLFRLSRYDGEGLHFLRCCSCIWTSSTFFCTCCAFWKAEELRSTSASDKILQNYLFPLRKDAPSDRIALCAIF